MEVLGLGGRVGDADVALVAQLKEPFQSGARVLRSLPLVAVRQQERKARRQPPLGKPGRKELIYDDLAAVDEVTELRLPQHQGLGCLGAVAVLEAETRELRQRAVVELDWSECARQPLDGGVPLAGLDVVEHQMALAERAALGVLPGEPDRHAFYDQRCKRK